MTYSLTRSDVNGGSAVSLGHVQKEHSSKETNMFEQAMPGQNSNQAIVLDLFGTTRKLHIDGRYQDTITNIRTFFGFMEAFINGNQTGPTTYTSDFRNGTILGYISNFTYDFMDGDPNQLHYTFDFTEGA